MPCLSVGLFHGDLFHGRLFHGGPFCIGLTKKTTRAPVFAIRASASSLVSHVVLCPKNNISEKGAGRGTGNLCSMGGT